ncbi:MAG: hypothetical protein ABIH26_01205, partial [Candidatus Eisenbacteria bacterium]
RALDGACARPEVTPKLLDRAARRLLGLYRGGGRPVREAIQEMRICWDPRLSANVAVSLAREFLAAVHECRLESARDMIRVTLGRMDIRVLPAVLSSLRTSTYESERILALDLFGELLHEAPEDAGIEEDVVAGGLKLVRKLREEDATRRAALEAAGRAAAGVLMSAKEVDGLAEELVGLLGRVSYAYDVASALAWVAGGPRLSSKVRTKIGMRFLELLDAEYPQQVGRQRKTAEGIVLDVSHSSRAYTDLVPSVLRGLEGVALAADTPTAFREGLIERLLARWSALLEFEVVWGPSNTIHLAGILGRLAGSPVCPEYLGRRLAEALLRRVTNLAVLEILSDLFARESRLDVPDLCERFVEDLLRISAEREFQEPDDREVVLRALGKVAGRTALHASPVKGEALRRRVIEALLEGRRQNFSVAQVGLERLKEDEHLPAALRKRIAERLEFSGIARGARGR